MLRSQPADQRQNQKQNQQQSQQQKQQQQSILGQARESAHVAGRQRINGATSVRIAMQHAPLAFTGPTKIGPAPPTPQKLTRVFKLPVCQISLGKSREKAPQAPNLADLHLEKFTENRFSKFSAGGRGPNVEATDFLGPRTKTYTQTMCGKAFGVIVTRLI